MLERIAVHSTELVGHPCAPRLVDVLAEQPQCMKSPLPFDSGPWSILSQIGSKYPTVT